MIVTVEELKHSLRLETDEDDAMLETLLQTAEDMVRDILRIDEAEELSSASAAKVAVLYAASYLYENRTEANHKNLTLDLRALLFGDRKASF